MPVPICVEHALEMHCVENDYLVSDRATDRSPASYWFGDMFRCPHPDCRAAIVTGFGVRIPDDGEMGPPEIVFDRFREEDL